MARVQTSYVEPGLTKEEQDIAMQALANAGQPAQPPAVQRSPAPQAPSQSPGRAGTQLSPEEEARFLREMEGGEGYKQWRDEFIQKNGGAPNLDDPDYDYRAAWKAGIRPERYGHDGGAYHWASADGNGQMLKSENHPTAWMEHFMRATGKDPNELGIKTKEAGAAYLASRGAGGQPPRRAEPDGPGAAELEARADNRQRPGWQNTLASVFAAIAESTGSTGAMARTQAGQRQAAQDRNAAIAAAREVDRSGRPADQATRELMKLGGLSDEATTGLTRGSEAIKLAQSGMGQLGARYRGQDLTAEQKAQHDANMLAMLERRLGEQGNRQQFSEGKKDERLDKSLAAREKIAAMKKGGKKTPEQVAATAAAQAQGDGGLLAAHANVTPEVADAFLRGDPVDVDEATVTRLKIGQRMLASGALDRGKASLNTFGREGANVDMPERTAATKQADPEKKRQVRDELEQDKRVLTAAITGWKGLSPKAQQILVQNGGLAPSQLMSALKSARLSDEEQIAASRLQRLINEDIKRLSGSAVSATEGGRQGTAIGMAAGDFNPWQSPAVLNDYLKHARGVLEGRWNSASKAYPDLWEGSKK